MKATRGFGVLVLGLAGFLYLFGLPVSQSVAERSSVTFSKDARYNVYYSVGETAQSVADVKILETVTIGGVAFLEIQYQGITEKIGYILLASVKAILPADSPKPKNTE